ncbi:hypothetical protein IB275_13280 [Pseudomonas sp. PDM21]|nr:hypothetical protein [Pseudomonas sp. PDM21]MBD9671551.1 hypothetical protein [Pseudomonas sp. PDM21]
MSVNTSSLLADPLSDVTRKERRNLLLFSALSLAVAHMRIVPTKLSALGIEFGAPEQGAFLLLMALCVGYFIVAFSIYASADFLLWRKKQHDQFVEIFEEASTMTQEEKSWYDHVRREAPDVTWFYRLSPAVAWSRGGFEFGLPLLVGMYAVAALLFRYSAV